MRDATPIDRLGFKALLEPILGSHRSHPGLCRDAEPPFALGLDAGCSS
jgi:hypothetical protein